MRSGDTPIHNEFDQTVLHILMCHRIRIEQRVLPNLVLWLTYFIYLWSDFLPQKASHYSAIRDTLIRSLWSPFAIKTQKNARLFRELFRERRKMSFYFYRILLLCCFQGISQLLTRVWPWERGRRNSEILCFVFLIKSLIKILFSSGNVIHINATDI